MKRISNFIFLTILVVLICSMICFATEEQFPEKEEALPITLVIHKIDGGTELPVSDAEFILLREDGTYLASAPGVSQPEWNRNENKAYTLVTDRDGIITLPGLLPDVYYLKEIAAPEGYILLEEPVKILISAEYGTDEQGNPVITKLTARIDEEETVDSTSDGQDTIEITIENTYDTFLPETGGIGTSVFYMFGFMILFAFSLVVAAKRLIREQ